MSVHKGPASQETMSPVPVLLYVAATTSAVYAKQCLARPVPSEHGRRQQAMKLLAGTLQRQLRWWCVCGCAFAGTAVCLC